MRTTYRRAPIWYFFSSKIFSSPPRSQRRHFAINNSDTTKVVCFYNNITPLYDEYSTVMTLSYLLLSLLLAVASAGTNEAGLAFLAENKDQPGVQALESGLQYKVLKKGKGPAHPTVNSPCSCHYEGKLLDGTVFDSSYERGEPTTFAPNQVIKGWTEAMQMMVAGDKWELYIPSELAYGDRGSPPKIGGGDVLIFQMEILSILGDTVPANKCDPTDDDLSECNEKEQKYIAKVKGWTPEKRQSEVGRLFNILQNPMSEDLRDWARRRANIMNLLVGAERQDSEL